MYITLSIYLLDPVRFTDRPALTRISIAQDLEYVCEEYGGRVELAKAYYEGLTKSLAKNFKGTGLFSSMQQCNDFFLLGTRQISIGRVGSSLFQKYP